MVRENLNPTIDPQAKYNVTYVAGSVEDKERQTRREDLAGRIALALIEHNEMSPFTVAEISNKIAELIIK